MRFPIPAVDFPTPLNTQPEHFADIGDEVIVDFLLCPLVPNLLAEHQQITVIRKLAHERLQQC
jgi:hypothetical protein